MAGGSLPRGGKAALFRRLSELAPAEVRTRVTQFIDAVAYKDDISSMIESTAANPSTPAAHDHDEYALASHAHGASSHTHNWPKTLGAMTDVEILSPEPGDLLHFGLVRWGNGPPRFSDEYFGISNFDDDTKVVDFDISALTTKTTRTVSAVDAPMTIPPTADWTDLTDGGLTYLHTHDHDFLYGAGYYTHYEIDMFIDSGGGGVTDHTLLSNIGTNTHAQIDSHIADILTNPHAVTLAQVGGAAASHSHTETDITDLDHTDTAAIHGSVAGEINALVASSVGIADVFLYEQSAGYIKRKVSFVNLVNYIDARLAAITPSHTHDGRYYTETEIDTLLTGYLPLTAGSGKSLTDSLFITRSSGFGAAVQIGDGVATSSFTHTASAIAMYWQDTSSGGGAGEYHQIKMQGGRPAYATGTLSPATGTSVDIALESDLDSYLPLTAGSTKPLSGDLYVDTVSDPAIFLREGGDASNFSRIVNVDDTTFLFEHINTGGLASIDINPMPTNGSSQARFRFFRETNTTGGRDVVFFLGDGTGTIQHQIECDTGDVDLCQQTGTLTVGDGTNNVLIDPVNGVYLRGSATMWDDLRVPVDSTKAGGSKDPTFGVFKTNGAGSQGVFTQWFNKNSEQELYFSAQLPHSWKEGTDIEAHVHWVPASTAAGAGTDVCWGLEYTWSNINGTFGNTTIIYGDEQSNGATETITVDKHYLTELGTITGTGKTLSSMLVCRIFRDAGGTGGTDDYDDDAGLLEIDFHYQIDSFGSDDEYTKGP